MVSRQTHQQIQKLARLFDGWQKINRKILANTIEIVRITNMLLREEAPKKPHQKINKLFDANSALHDKVLRIDIDILEIAKEKLAEEI